MRPPSLTQPDLEQTDVYYANRAAAYILGRQWAPALRDCESALALNPKNVKAVRRAITCAAELGDFTQGLAFAEKFSSLGFEEKEVSLLAFRMQQVSARLIQYQEKLNQARDLAKAGKYQTALDALRLVKHQATLGRSWRLLELECMVRTGQAEAALTDLGRLGGDSGDAQFYFVRGLALVYNGQR